jgi:hypothetical protein
VQPFVVKTVFPAAGSPFAYSGGTVSAWVVVCPPGTVPITVCGVGVTTVALPHPAAKKTVRTATGARRRTGATVPFEA